MDNAKNDRYFIKKVIENIDAILKYSEGKTKEELLNDGVILDAILFRLIQMAENLNHISSSFKESHPEIKWKQIIGFRNGIVHEYGKTDYSIVYEIVSSDISKLETQLLFKD